ncbi:MAG TPA: hypothetical protein V6D10_17735 [Trichocoleus sp.]|jgi:flagellar hook-basal body complex protein FliE
MTEEINAGSLKITLEADDTLLLQQVQQTAKKVAQEVSQSLARSFTQANQSQQQALSTARQLTEEERKGLQISQEAAKAVERQLVSS